MGGRALAITSGNKGVSPRQMSRVWAKAIRPFVAVCAVSATVSKRPSADSPDHGRRGLWLVKVWLLTKCKRAAERVCAGRGREKLACECVSNASREVAIASSPTSTLSPKKNRRMLSISSGSCVFRRKKSAVRGRARKFLVKNHGVMFFVDFFRVVKWSGFCSLGAFNPELARANQKQKNERKQKRRSATVRP